MEILKIDHLGIAVNSIDDGKNFWSNVLGLKFEGAETVDTQKVTTAFFPVGESEVELLESTSPDGPVAKFIEKKGTGFQHVAFRVANIEAALQELKDKGIQLIDQQPRIGRIGLDLLAQPVDVRLQRVRGDPGVIAPDLMQQHVAGDHALAGAIEIFEDRGFLLGQHDLAAGAVN